MALSSITSTAPTYTTSTPATTTTTSSTATASNTTAASTPDATTSVALSALSVEAGIVATLGRPAPEFQTYDATGLLNLVAQAGMAAAGAVVQASSAGAAASGQAASTDTSAGTSPDTSAETSDAAGSPGTSVTAAVPGDWGTILKSNPGLTSVAVADAVAQGIVNTINVYV